MVNVSKKKLKSSAVTIDAPVLMVYTSSSPDDRIPVWMDKEWLPDLLDQIKETKVKIKNLRYHNNKITIRFASPKDATMFRLTYEQRTKKKIF
jgi:hypothetical protein